MLDLEQLDVDVDAVDAQLLGEGDELRDRRSRASGSVKNRSFFRVAERGVDELRPDAAWSRAPAGSLADRPR